MADYYAAETGTGNLSVDQTAFEKLAYFALRDEMYFDQFLAFFGASLIGGHFVDVTTAI